MNAGNSPAFFIFSYHSSTIHLYQDDGLSDNRELVSPGEFNDFDFLSKSFDSATEIRIKKKNSLHFEESSYW